MPENKCVLYSHLDERELVLRGVKYKIRVFIPKKQKRALKLIVGALNKLFTLGKKIIYILLRDIVVIIVFYRR